MSSSRAIGVGVLLVWTLVATLLRAVRWPNDFAEAHWLLDYRYGLVKRGLVGEILGAFISPFGATPSEALIAGLSVLAFVTLCVVLLVLALRVVVRAGWSPAAVLAVVAFVSSPFIVMSAHLMGYFDHLVVLLTVLGVWLVLRGRLWPAATVMAVAVLVHENAILVGLPVLSLAWWLVGSDRRGGIGRPGRWAPLALPIAAFGALAVAGGVMDPDGFRNTMTPYLERFPFVAGDMHIFVPEWLSASLAANLDEQMRHFPRRISSAESLGLVLPTTLAIVALVLGGRRARTRPVEVALLVGVCMAPQVMHLAAWDTIRIWTFTIATTFLATWAWSEVRGLDTDAPAVVLLLGATALVVNVLVMTPLLDNLADRYTLGTRLWLYAPVVVGCVLVSWSGQSSNRPTQT